MRTSEYGLTLLELLVVVFILSSIALLTVSVVDSADEQLRYDETRSRLELVQRGIVGDSSFKLNGEPMVAGFVSDIGRLPENVTELLEPVDLILWASYPETGLSSGWRGPYIEPLLEKNEAGVPVYTFRDGWANPVWKEFRPDEEGLIMQSFGSDGKAGGVDYAADYPPDEFSRIVGVHDYLVDVQELVIKARVKSTMTQTLKLRLRVLYPRDGSLSDLPWPSERDEQNDMSEVKEVTPTSQPMEVEFCFAIKNPGSPGSNWEKKVPMGQRSIVVVDDDTGEIMKTIKPIRIKLIPRASLPDLPEQIWTFDKEPQYTGGE